MNDQNRNHNSVKHTNMKAILLIITALAGFNLSAATLNQDAANTEPDRLRVTIIQDVGIEGPALHGLQKLSENMKVQNISVTQGEEPVAEAADYFILAGLSGEGGPAEMKLKVLNIPVTDTPEAIVIQKSEYLGKPALILCGSDEVGLMYACLDVSKRISWAAKDEDPFKYVSDVQEEPYLIERAVSKHPDRRT